MTVFSQIWISTYGLLTKALYDVLKGLEHPWNGALKQAAFTQINKASLRPTRSNKALSPFIHEEMGWFWGC